MAISGVLKPSSSISPYLGPTKTMSSRSRKSSDLAGYGIRALNGSVFTLGALTLDGGQTSRVGLPADVAPLANKGGELALLDPAGQVADLVSYSRSEAKKQGWTWCSE